MKIRIKTLEELGGKIPNDWRVEMSGLCGKVIIVDNIYEKNYSIYGTWLISKSDAVVLEEVEE